ncbi:MAG: alanine racemase [Alphaproteobacteria bacterium]|jgi:alanine racemase|nr:alanine racemase [Alphaproteobacteria bacterium]
MTEPVDIPARSGAVLTIDLAALAENWRRLDALTGPADCAAVVKADAYGLGLDQAAPALWAAGARTFFVALPDEAFRLQALLPKARIGILDGLFPGIETELAEAGLVPVLNDLGEIERWSAEAGRAGRPLPAYVHLDTGMNRLGLPAADRTILAGEPERLDGVEIAGYMSHFACADEADHPMTATQTATFLRALNYLPPGPASLANSSGIFRGQETHFDMVRPGAALYGVNPTPEADNPMQPVARVDARVLKVGWVSSPETIGYGATYMVMGQARIATIAAGYADGMIRAMGNQGAVVIGGARCPIVGIVSMDLITVDVSHLAEEAVQAGDTAQLIGPDMPVDTVAESAGTIGYEILTALGSRYARRYIGEATGADDGNGDARGAAE